MNGFNDRTPSRIRIGGFLAMALTIGSCATAGSVSTTAPPSTEPSPVTSQPVDPEPAPGMFISSELARQTPQADPGKLAATVMADTLFAFDLFAELRGAENLMISPYSVASALTMAYAGAAGTTADEMAAVLHLAGEPDDAHVGRNLLDSSLTASSPIGDDEPFALNVANSVWGQAGYGFQPEFLDTLASNYGAGLYTVDYLTDPDGARLAINEWVENETQERIKDLVPPGAVNSDTRLVLANAIWFKASWLTPFSPEATIDGPFTLLGGETISVPMMHRTERSFAGSGTGYLAAELPYIGDASMLVIVPEAGRFAEVAETFDAAELVRLDESLRPTEVRLVMPKFTYETEAGLVAPLTALGMKTAFLPPPGGADFSGISRPSELFIGEVAHKSFIAVDEEGTEAAAATAVVMQVTSASSDLLELTIDRPFLYLIRQSSTGEILFIGQVTDPS